MKVLITGAESFIGTELARRCSTRAIEVVGLDAIARQTGTIQADIRDSGIGDCFPDDLDAVIHLAAISRDPDCRRDPKTCYEVNVAGTLNVFEAARSRGAKQLVFASTEWVYDSFDPDHARSEDDPIDATKLTSDYAASKLAAETALAIRNRETGIPVTVLRFGIIYGPRKTNWSAVESLLSSVADGGPVRIGSRRTARGFVHVTDIADGILSSVGQSGFEVINLQADAPVTLGEVIDASAKLTGRRPEVIESDPDRPNIRRVSNRKAKTVLGWHPQISLDAGLKSVAGHLGFIAGAPA